MLLVILTSSGKFLMHAGDIGGVLDIIKGVISNNDTFQKEHFDKYQNQKCLLFGALTDQLYSLTTLTYH